MSILSRVWRWLDPPAEYIGCAVGKEHLVKEDGSIVPGTARECHYLLFTRGGAREVRQIGQHATSRHGQIVRTSVAAWKLGGPLPVDFLDPQYRPGPRGKLVAISGPTRATQEGEG